MTRLEKLQRDWARQDKNERDAAVTALLQHRHGRKYLWWLLSTTKAIGVSPFTNNALATSFNCGEQNVGIQILQHILEVAPDGFIHMMKENADEQRARDSRSADASGNGRDSYIDSSAPDADGAASGAEAAGG